MIPSRHVTVVANCDEDRPHLHKLLRTYHSLGYNVSFVGWDRLARKKDRTEENGVEYRYLQRGWGSANRTLILGIPLWALRLFLCMLRTREDLVHVIDLDSAAPVTLATLLKRVPFVYDIRDTYSLRHNWPAPIRKALERLDAWVTSRATGIVVVDESRIQGSLLHNRNKIVILYNAPPDVPNPHAHNPRRPFTIYSSGYLSRRRGVDLLLDATEHLPHMRVLLAGRFVEKDLEQKALANPQVDFRGWLVQEDALRLCYEADLVYAFYDPSTEINRLAASNKWFDAMMAGRPILVNSEVVKSEWIVNQEIGYTCPYGNVDQLAQVLEYVHQHQEDAKQKGMKGRRLFETGYSWQAMERRFDAFLNATVLPAASGGKSRVP